jgi:transketolase
MDVGIAEMTMIGMAAGMAVRGRVVLTHALSAFLTMRAFEFIRDDVGIPALPVIMVGMVPGFLSDGNGPTHQAIEDVSLMRTIPNMGVFCPADEVDLVAGMPHIIASGRPFYVRYNALPAAVDHDPNFTIGRGEIVHETSSVVADVTILTYGMLVRQAVQAADELERKGITVKVVNLRTLAPIDVSLLLDAVLSNALVVTLEDHFKIGGLYSILCELMVKHRVICPVLPLALDGKWFRPGRLADVLEYEGFTGPQIASRIRLALDNTSRSHHATSVIG